MSPFSYFRRYIAALAILISCNLCGSARAQSNKVALLTEPQGVIKIKRNGVGRPFNDLKSAFTFLNEKDTVVVKPGGRVTIWQPNRAYTRVHMKSGTEVIRVLPTPEPDPYISLSEYDQMVRIHLSATKNSNKPSPAEAGAPDKRRFYLLSPRQELLLSASPRIYWTPVPNTVKVEVTIYDENEEVKSQQGVMGQAARTATSVPVDLKLAPGSYTAEITVTAQGPGGVELTFKDPQPFEVAKPDQIAKINTALGRVRSALAGVTTANLPYISFCLDHKLFALAEAELLRNLRTAPKDKGLLNLLMEVYLRTERFQDRETVRKSGVVPAYLLEGHPLGVNAP